MKYLTAVCVACVWILGVGANGQDCPSGSECVSLQRCPAALQALQDRGRPDGPSSPRHCGFDGPVPRVCCARRAGGQPVDTVSEVSSTCSPRRVTGEPILPANVTCEQLPQFLADSKSDAEDKAPGRVARRMCRFHQEEHCRLPAHIPKDLCPYGGLYADILEFPHMALLGYGERDAIEYACGGSLISPEFILTAAHCARISEDRVVRWALLGATNRTSMRPKANDTHQLLEIVDVIVHPEYLPPAKYHDIALLRLEKAAKVNVNDVRPACINTDVDTDPVGLIAVATGWGATYFGDDGSQSLLKVNLTVRNLQYCRDNVEFQQEVIPAGLVDGQLCAGGGPKSSDTCQGDSGGPLQLQADPELPPCVYRIIGVVSFGPPCGLDKPGIYTNVAPYVEWIEKIVWPVKPDNCATVETNTGVKVDIPYSSPGSVARGMCRVYHVDFCPAYMPQNTLAKPDLSIDSRCHHNVPPSKWLQKETLPLTATLRYGAAGYYNEQYACGGALISPRAVLTAGRCSALGCLPVSKVILSSPGSCSSKHIVDVQSVHVHPEYRRGRAYADLAVVMLSVSLDLREYMPLCLHTTAHPPVLAGARVKTVGYNIQGLCEERARYALANTTLTVRTQDECKTHLLQADRVRDALPKGLLASQLCAGGICDDESYPGDSGVPMTARSHLLVSEHGKFFLDRVLGVSSSETYCSSRTKNGQRLPDLFTRAASYVSWIESVVWPDERD